MSPQFSNRLFPDLRVFTDVVERHAGKGDPSGMTGDAVARDAVTVEHIADRSGTCWAALGNRIGLRLCKWLRRDQRQRKKD